MFWTLIGTLGSKLITAYNKRVDSDTQIQLELIKGHTATAGHRRDVILAAMSTKIFWVVWATFSMPLALWWFLVMLDTMTPPSVLSLGIPALPLSIKPYADQIFNNVFYSGAVVGTVQVAAKGLFGTLLTGKR